MASSRRWSIGWFGIGFAALLLGGCARAATGSDRPGELALEVEPGASYSVVGRFRFVGVEPTATGREVDFAADTSTIRLPLAAGAYVLSLHAGARVVCKDDGTMPHAESNPELASSERLVSTWPQRIAIQPGQVTTARINLGAPPSPRGVEPLVDAPTSPDPCASFPMDGGAEHALLSR